MRREGNGGGKKEECSETISMESHRLSLSSVPMPVQSRSMGNVVSAPAPPTGAESSPLEVSKTEGKEETEVACPWAHHVPSVVKRSVSVGGSCWGYKYGLCSQGGCGHGNGSGTRLEHSLCRGRGGAMEKLGEGPSS